jgi:hypothetical protein
MSATKDKMSVIVTLAEDARQRLDEMLKKLEHAGLHSAKDLGFGMVQGQIAPDKLKAIEDVPGVKRARPEIRDYRPS